MWLTHTIGIRVTDLAVLEVADVLYPGGAIKPEVRICRPDAGAGYRVNPAGNLRTNVTCSWPTRSTVLDATYVATLASNVA